MNGVLHLSLKGSYPMKWSRHVKKKSVDSLSLYENKVAKGYSEEHHL